MYKLLGVMDKKMNYDSIPMNNKAIDKLSKKTGKDFKFPESDMEVTITASSQTVQRGGGAPTPGSANVDKVVEMKGKRTFKSDEALTKEEKKEGGRATSKTYSNQKVTFKK
jgi:hypothetical protein